MQQKTLVADGLYRLVKQREDGNPVFPSRDTVVEVRAGQVINISTGRSWPLRLLGAERVLFGPLASPYDSTHLARLPRIELSKRAGADITTPRATFHPPLNT